MSGSQQVSFFDSDKVSLTQAKVFIINALSNFDEALGARATKILQDDNRLNIVEQDEPSTNIMMSCSPAGITIDDLKAMDMYIEDDAFRKKFGPYFTEQENRRAHAVINLEYHGTVESVSWFAHELGHAIADDVQVDNDKTFRDFSWDELEQQAYLVQFIVAAKMIEKNPQYSIDDFGLGSIQSSRERVSQVGHARDLYEQALEKTEASRTDFVLGVMSGGEVSSQVYADRHHTPRIENN